MAGVSVQAFRRQGRRFGAGSCARRWSAAPGSSTATSGRSATSGSPRTSIRSPIQLFGSDPATMAEAAAMVEAAGADLVDLNFGCPVRKVTKTGAGATLLEDPERACRIVDAIADAVKFPGDGEDAARAPRRLARRASRWGRASSTPARLAHAPPALCPADVHRHRRPHADGGARRRSSTYPLSRRATSCRGRAQAVLATSGASAVMVGRGAQGNPWALGEIVDGERRDPSREEVVAELVLFIRETVRELGEHRASGFLKKFYGWYLGRSRFPRTFRRDPSARLGGRGRAPAARRRAGRDRAGGAPRG